MKRSRRVKHQRKIQCPRCPRQIGLSGYKHHQEWHNKMLPSVPMRPNEGQCLTPAPISEAEMHIKRIAYMNGFEEGFQEGFSRARRM